jgi:hypothetical protein
LQIKFRWQGNSALKGGGREVTVIQLLNSPWERNKNHTAKFRLLESACNMVTVNDQAQNENNKRPLEDNTAPEVTENDGTLRESIRR